MKNLNNYQGGGNLTAPKALYLYAFIFLFFGTMVTTYNSFAQTPNIITYQGKLTHQGTDVSGERAITARLYGDAEGTETVWEGTYKTYVTDGIFALPLGAGKYPLPAPTKLDKQLWVGITVDGIELRPLTQLTSSPYALNVADKSITKAKLADDVLLGTIGGQKPQAVGSNALLGGNLFDRAPGDEYFGSNGSTTGSKQVWFKTYGTTALRLSHSTATSGTPNIIGGYSGNVIDSAVKGAVIGGGGESSNINTVITDFGFIGSGKLNTVGNSSHTTNVSQAIVAGQNNTAVAHQSFIGAGHGNLTFNDAENSVIGGGYLNETRKAGSFIGGGYENHAYSLYTVIGGGANNTITGLSENSSILGGASNTIDAYYSTIGGGNTNSIGASGGSLPKWSTIGGGQENQILTSDYHSTIAGGYSNLIKGGGSNVIVGGYNNQINSLTSPRIYPNHYSFIGGGYNNLIDSYDDPNDVSYSTIVGGKDNYTMESRVFIGGGESNLADEDWTVVTGGKDNETRGYYGFAGGGHNNKVGTFHTDGFASTISGGNDNSISGEYSFIGGGKSNSVIHSLTGYNTISGGLSNEINATKSTISGGDNNTITNSIDVISGATIAGGASNTVSSYYATISGGIGNTSSGVNSFIGGGGGILTGGVNYGNTASGDGSIVVGGSENESNTTYANILGGTGLKATGIAQTVIGVYNKVQGTAGNNINQILGDDRMFIVGAGTGRQVNLRKNAFEVSNNGHSIVYHNNTLSNNSAIKGARYIDNTPIAWGYVDKNGNLVVNAGFGVTAVTPGPGSLVTVDLTYTDPYTGSQVPILLNQSSVVATIVDDGESPYCSHVVVKPVTWNPALQLNQVLFRTFVKNITQDTDDKDIHVSCDEQRVPFMFAVFARP